MSISNICKKFPHSKYGYEISYNILNTKYNIDINLLAYDIGKMYSYLHFILNIDGYDCELLCGSNSILSSIPYFYLIDFDKVQKFTFELNTIVYRKIDEQIIDTIDLKTNRKFAWFLFTAMSSMSLIPIDTILQKYFINGYKTFIPTTNPLIQEISKEIINIINNEYEI
jgi:GR25 family glycosyltransferase involved in LPS biosynthesis